MAQDPTPTERIVRLETSFEFMKEKLDKIEGGIVSLDGKSTALLQKLELSQKDLVSYEKHAQICAQHTEELLKAIQAGKPPKISKRSWLPKSTISKIALIVVTGIFLLSLVFSAAFLETKISASAKDKSFAIEPAHKTQIDDAKTE